MRPIWQSTDVGRTWRVVASNGGALVAPSIIAPAGQPVVAGWDQAGYGVAFVAAIVTRRMLPSLAAGLVVVIGVALIRH